jgi:hypothetical protein
MKTRHMIMTHCDLAGVCNKAHSQTASKEKGISRFEVTGIYPLNCNIFSSDFLALATLQNTIQEFLLQRGQLYQ